MHVCCDEVAVQQQAQKRNKQTRSRAVLARGRGSERHYRPSAIRMNREAVYRHIQLAVWYWDPRLRWYCGWGWRTVGYACHGEAAVSRYVDRVLVPVPDQNVRPVLTAAVTCLGKADVVHSKMETRRH